jgi:serine/threonine-protein kinase HipA
MHQEDFCQALGIVSENKYQREGGPSLKNGFELLRDVSATPVIDLQRFLDAIIFNFLVGNHDAHGKNFSLTADQASIRLAPLYDIVCTAFYPELNRKMAMKIGGEYESAKIYPRHFEKMAEECGLAKPLVRKRIPELAETMITALDKINIQHPVADGVKDLIKENCQGTITIFGE